MPTILIVAASPLDQDRLRLNAEVRDIRNALRRSRNRENWTIESNEAVTVDDLRRALLDFHPAIVHFAGHGSGPGGLCFEDSDGNTHSTDAKPLAKLFHHFKDNLKCVALNACYSDEQGEVIRQGIDYVVGMHTTIEDEAARKFAVAFYDAIFAGTDFRTAFDLACTSLDLNNLPDSDVPVFMTSPHLGGGTLSYSAIIPEIERVLHAYYNTLYVDRWPFTTTGDPLLPQIKQYYGEKMRWTVDKVQVLTMNQIDTEHWRVAIGVSTDTIPEDTLVYLRIRDRTVLIEWEATVGLWSMPVKTYLALGSSEPVIARVVAELSDYYNYDFSGQKPVFQSVLLCPKSGEILHGYVPRNTSTYKQIMTILADGNPHSITIEILNASNLANMPLIQQLLSPTWLYTPVMRENYGNDILMETNYQMP